MYATKFPAKACVRLLNSTGYIGCAAQADTLSIGPLIHLQDWKEQKQHIQGLPSESIMANATRFIVSCDELLQQSSFNSLPCDHAGSNTVVIPERDLSGFLKEQKDDNLNGSSISAILVMPGTNLTLMSGQK